MCTNSILRYFFLFVSIDDKRAIYGIVSRELSAETVASKLNSGKYYIAFVDFFFIFILDLEFRFGK